MPRPYGLSRPPPWGEIWQAAQLLYPRRIIVGSAFAGRFEIHKTNIATTAATPPGVFNHCFGTAGPGLFIASRCFVWMLRPRWSREFRDGLGHRLQSSRRTAMVA